VWTISFLVLLVAGIIWLIRKLVRRRKEKALAA
jgi:flagellar biogenesis protein FliO